MSAPKFYRGSEAARAVSVAVPNMGDLVLTDEGNLYVGDGATAAGALKRVTRTDDVTTAVQQYVTSTIVTNTNLAALAAESGYTWALVDSNGKIALGVTPSGQVIGKISQAAGSLGLAALDASTQALIQKYQPVEGGGTSVWALVDGYNRYAVNVTADGSVAIPKLVLGSGIVPLTALTTGAQAQLPQVLGGESGYVFAVADASGRIGFGILPDGTVVAKGVVVADGSVTTAKLSTTVQGRLVNVTPDLFEVVGASPSRSLYRQSQTTGVRSPVRTTGDNRSPVRQPDGAVIFETEAGQMWQPASGGAAAAAWPDLTSVYCWGDSLTEGYPQGAGDFTDPTHQSWPGVMQTLVAGGVTVHNQGKTGQSAEEIAIRQGGVVLTTITVAGGSIPAAGSSVVCTITQGIDWRLDRSWSCYGTLAGVTGTLSRTSTDNATTLHFAPDVAGTATAVSGAQTFVSQQGTQGAGALAVVFAGRNDIGYTTAPDPDPVARVVAMTQAMVSRLTSYYKRVLLVGTTTSTSETAPGGNYAAVTSINSQLAALYPDKFYDLRHYLVTQAIYDLGLTPTTQDLANIAGDTLPPSIMATGGTDTVHYSVATASLVGHRVYEQLQQRGWLT